MNAPLLCLLLVTGYPLDEGARTHVRRLEWQRNVDAGKARGTKLPPGARWSGERIRLRMTEAGSGYVLSDKTPKDPALQAGLEKILAQNAFSHYSVAILDITDPKQPRFAGVAETREQTPGSVAKLLVATALLDSVAKRFGKDIAAREAFLRTTVVGADDWLMPNSHQVPVVDGPKVAIRAVKRGDRFTLWEWMDHALSPSSNAAGTLVWREATLMNLLGADYPPENRDAALFSRWSRADLTAAAFDAVDRPQTAAGLDPEKFRLRAFFTKGGGKYIHSKTSRTSPLALVQWMLKVEQANMVDAFSSLELKKLLYLTRRRVRYAQSPALADAAVFFKSGSLFECKPEPGYTCGQYRGNAVNVLNALVEVETEDGGVYIVAVMSNELKKNAALDHGRLAGEIHALVRGR